MTSTAAIWKSILFRLPGRTWADCGLLVVLVVILAFALAGWADDGADPSLSDGRLRPCGIVDEVGVTEYLDAYAERCGPIGS